jgi:hypothetical protein
MDFYEPLPPSHVAKGRKLPQNFNDEFVRNSLSGHADILKIKI